MLMQLGPYRIEEQLGAGGMGEIYKAYDDRLDRWVAIKRIRSDRNQTGENRERLQREARATARLNHASIVVSTTSSRRGRHSEVESETACDS